MNNRMTTNSLYSLLVGRKVDVYLVNNHVETCVLQGIFMDNIKDSYLKIEDQTGWSRKILFKNIKEIDFGFGKERIINKTDEDVANKVHILIKQKNQIAASAQFDTLKIFSDEIAYLLRVVKDEAFVDYFSVDKISKVSLGKNDYLYLIKELEKAKDKVDEHSYIVAEVILLLEAKMFKECLALCLDMLRKKNIQDSRIYLLISFITNQLRDYDQSFYWLEKSLMANIKIAVEHDFLWWRYLFNTVEFGSYEHLSTVFKNLFSLDKELTLKSLAYVLGLNNLFMQASYVYSLLNDINQCEFDDIESLISHLKSEIDNKYHRLLRCIDYIEKNNCYAVFEKDSGIKGLVFDYIPYKSYGFILGYDMMKYYFHSTETEPMTINKIKKEICSMVQLENEELCMVSFSRTADSKKSYTAYDVV